MRQPLSQKSLNIQPETAALALKIATARIITRGSQARISQVMKYNDTLLYKLIQNLVDRRFSAQQTFTWLKQECRQHGEIAPSRSSFYRFLLVARGAYRNALIELVTQDKEGEIHA